MTVQALIHPYEPESGFSAKPLFSQDIKKMIRFLDEWMTDESGYDEKTLPKLKKLLDRKRDNISARKLFNE
ncbi:MAG: hypothetical protein BWK80_34585 [Desulfobacteraceae bacterium IS3]|nr:MAG: hypothetical protein BWK80_34585 [Desulfobacteraceae bacterium IS3]